MTMQTPTWPDSVTQTARERLERVVNAVGQLSMKNRVYDSTGDMGTYYDADNNEYYVDGETPMFDHCEARLDGSDIVVSFCFNGPRGHWFDSGPYATTTYDVMAEHGMAVPQDTPTVGVRVDGDDVYIENIYHNATK